MRMTLPLLETVVLGCGLVIITWTYMKLVMCVRKHSIMPITNDYDSSRLLTQTTHL